MSHAPSPERIAPDVVLEFTIRVLTRCGVSSGNASTISRYLLEADQRGHNSHGVDLLPVYAESFRKGTFNGGAEPSTTMQLGSIAVVDGDNGLGHTTAHFATELACDLATQTGVGLVAARNSNHFGMAGHWPLIAVRRNFIGYATTNGPGIMSVWGASSRSIGNNPLSWGIPAGQFPPILLDMAMTPIARGKMRLAAESGVELPDGAGLNSVGEPTRSAAEVLAGTLLPMGGAKGSGLAVIDELLSSALSGANTTSGIPQEMPAKLGNLPSWGSGHFFAVIDPSRFRPLQEFLDSVDKTIRMLKAGPTAPGYSEVLMPGERGFRAEEEAHALGVQLPAQTIAKLADYAAHIGVEPLSSH